ncbi:Arm DNA-binding domain-containing protein [Sporosarcina sp. D27]|uniref:Arm DNA-binding domain-containing protein n=1 Tax=Sporosarcina sp. D27 TaxID=1382305 RepID=UPI0004728755|nr:Arm DNA-binding domain-containing protein [Sporosarcina sp. D27]
MFRHKYNDENGKRIEKKKSGFKTEKAALAALLEVKATSLRGETKHIEYDNLTVAEWLDTWFSTNKRKWKPATITQREKVKL